MQAGDVFKLMRTREHLMTFPTRNLIPKLDNMLIILFADFPSMANSPIHYFPWEEIYSQPTIWMLSCRHWCNHNRSKVSYLVFEVYNEIVFQILFAQFLHLNPKPLFSLMITDVGLRDSYILNLKALNHIDLHSTMLFSCSVNCSLVNTMHQNTDSTSLILWGS